MAGVNRVTILGNLGADPEVKHITNDTLMARLNIATSKAWIDKKTGEKREKTEWHRVVFWGRIAEIAKSYLKKGAKVFVEGELETTSYTDKNGIERWATQIIGHTMNMCASPKSGGGGKRRPYVDDEEFEAQKQLYANQSGASSTKQSHIPDDFDENEELPF